MLHRNHCFVALGALCLLPLVGGCPTVQDGIPDFGPDITARVAVETPVAQDNGMFSITITLQSDDDDWEAVIGDIRINAGGGDLRWFDVQVLKSGTKHATMHDVPAIDGVRVYGPVALKKFGVVYRNDNIDKTFYFATGSADDGWSTPGSDDSDSGGSDNGNDNGSGGGTDQNVDKLSGTIKVLAHDLGDGRFVFEQTISNEWSEGDENVVDYDTRLQLAEWPGNGWIQIQAWGNGWDWVNEIPRNYPDTGAITVNTLDASEFGRVNPDDLPTSVQVVIKVYWDKPGHPNAVTTTGDSGKITLE